jgi:hypothetical protein
MGTHTEHDLSRPHVGPFNHDDSWLKSLAALALELPAGLARMAAVFFESRSDAADRGKPRVPPMSHDWLREFSSHESKNDTHRY